MKCQILFSRKNKKNIISLSSLNLPIAWLLVLIFGMLGKIFSRSHLEIFFPYIRQKIGLKTHALFCLC